jgi:hypothetical protein
LLIGDKKNNNLRSNESGNFILSPLAILPFTIFGKMKTDIFSRTDKGFKINAGEGRIHGHIKLKGVNANVQDVKVSGSDTDGALAVFEQTSLTQSDAFEKPTCVVTH